VSEEGFDLCCSHFSRMAFIVKKDIPPRPMNVGFLGAIGIIEIMLQTDCVSDLVEEFSGFLG
jgi:hypothetical protein